MQSLLMRKLNIVGSILSQCGSMVEVKEENAIPTILTISAKEIFKHYKEQIVEMDAMGGHYGKNEVVVDKDYGLYLDNPGQTKMVLHYKQERNEEGKILNPLTDEKVKEICDKINERLPSYYDEDEDKQYPPDLSVERLVIEVKDKELQTISNSNTNVFDITFGSDIVETPELREKTQNRNKYLGLVKLQGFKIRNLNMHKLIETREKYGQSKPSYIQQWNGLTDIHPKSPLKIAQRVYTTHLPEKYAELNFVSVVERNRAILTPIAR